jgi:hypothetical protein
MAEDRRHDAEETPTDATPVEVAPSETAPAESSTVYVAPAEAAPTESPAPSQSVAVAQVSDTPTQTHTQAQIDLDNLREREAVLPMDSVPPADQQSDMPADLQELRQAPSTPRSPVVDNERRYGPLSGSMWFLIVAITAFVLTLLIRLLS